MNAHARRGRGNLKEKICNLGSHLPATHRSSGVRAIAEATSLVNILIKVLDDGQKAFTHAAVAAPDAQLKSLFSALSRQRAQFAEELRMEVMLLEQTDPGESNLSIALRRALMNLRAAITKQNERALFAQDERSEVAEFRRTMDDIARHARERHGQWRTTRKN